MAKQVYLWLCRVMHGYVGLCRVMCGQVGLRRAIQGFVGLWGCIYTLLVVNDVKPLYDADITYLLEGGQVRGVSIIQWFHVSYQKHIQTYIILHSPTQPYIAVHSPTQPYKALHSPRQPYITLHGPKQPYMAIHSPTQAYIGIHRPIQLYIALHRTTPRTYRRGEFAEHNIAGSFFLSHNTWS